MRRTEGFTLIEVLVVMAILATLAGMVALIVPIAQERANRTQCVHNVRDLVGLFESRSMARYPEQGGPAALLEFVRRGDLAGRDALEKLFCSGDLAESLARAGGPEAYEGLDTTDAADLDHLTSYAVRDFPTGACRVARGRLPAVVLLADDSEDHHNGKGFVVGLSGGAAKWRDKVDDYGGDAAEPVNVGEASAIEELRCLR